MNIALRITIVYLIISGLIGMAWPLLNFGPQYAGLEIQTLAEKFGSYRRELFIAVAFFISGIGLLKHKLWARTVGLVGLGLAFFYGGNVMSWSWADGEPTISIIIYSYTISFIWFGIWFLILYRKSTVLQLKKLSD